MKIIAKYHGAFGLKFGVPKQSGLVPELKGTIVFEPKYRNPDALRGIEDFEYIWLIWGFSANKHDTTSPTVRPPLLGGNERLGVFATRSPFRPNPIGLSSVKIESVEMDNEKGPFIRVKGADLMDGTPIYDIKPYIEYVDSHTGIRSGFVDSHPMKKLSVHIPEGIANQYVKDDYEALKKTLELDPRPHYHKDSQKVYGMLFKGKDIHFRVDGDDLFVI